jgi:DNA recombination protein RmuC
MDAVLLLLLLSIILILIFRFKKVAPPDQSTYHEEIAELRIKLAVKEEEIKTLNDKLLSEKDREVRLTTEFENLSFKILEQNSKKFKEQNAEQLESILSPLGKEIDIFRKKLDKSNDDFLKGNIALTEHLKTLQGLNQQLSQDTHNLTSALIGDSKTQGDWGEKQLEVLLERTGLMRNVHFTTQGGYRDENGDLKKPDFIIKLPDDKHIVIDSKVSLTAYYDYSSSEDVEIRKEALKRHLASVRKHFSDLGKKNYQSLYGINSPDHVLMFVPIEPALMLAYQQDSDLHLDAFDKKVVLMSTSILLATLNTISSIWKQENQKRNVIEIAKQGGLLYDKFVGFVEDLLKVGKSLDASKESYSDAMNKLVDGKGNLITKVEKLRELEAKTNKNIPKNLLDRAHGD